MNRTRREEKILEKELEKAQKADDKFFKKALKDKDEGTISSKIREKIPEKAMSALETAFESGFSLLFNKGDGIIEKTGSIRKARERYEEYAQSLDRMIYPDTLKAVDKSANNRVLSSKGVTTAEGTALGVFGIGLPDIPIFLGMLLKTSYEIAAGYGIDYRDEREKQYTLALFNSVFAKGQEKIDFSKQCDEIGQMIDDNEPISTEIAEEDMKRVSNILATDMLVAKFIQGMTFVGVLGGPLNYRLVHKVSVVAKMKYKKRFLYRLINDVKPLQIEEY